MLPEGFITRMKELLGSDFPAFDNALSEPPVKGIRANGIKISPEALERTLDFKLERIPYTEDGFIPERQSGLGNLPEHHAGMIYSQDPGAMSAVCALDLKEGDRVLDACSAPGGKSAQIAAKIGDSGFLLSNEYVPKRAKIIVGNFERLGIKNAIVTSLDTAEFPKMFDGYFDAIVCDAPCSGEGMFRKCDDAVLDWSEENVRSCARRQLEILSNCAPALKAGGQLLYSTCTYSIEENEGVVSEFLRLHPDFYIAEVPERLRLATSDGLVPSPDFPEELKMTRRFYPHKSQGEGQYVALLKKRENTPKMKTILYNDSTKAPSKQELAIISEFIKSTFINPPSGKIIKCGEGFALLCHTTPIPEKSVFMSGIMLGEIRGKNFFPHHQLFSALGLDMRLKVELKRDDPRVTKYLRGEEISTELCGSGWCAVIYEGAALGGGKLSGGTVKNHYPKGLRSH